MESSSLNIQGPNICLPPSVNNNSCLCLYQNLTEPAQDTRDTKKHSGYTFFNVYQITG
jgi:hypothetical protein